MAIGRIFRFLAAAVLIIASSGRPLSADTVPLTDRQMVHESEHIVVVVVEGAQARWNVQHTLIFTDYDLRLEDRLKGNAPQRFTLSLPGGTLDGETHLTSLDTPLAPGSRYLLFLGDLSQPGMAPITGAENGVFRELAAADGKLYAAPGGAGTAALDHGQLVEFKDFVAAVRGLVERVAAHPETTDAPAKSAGGPALPAKRYDPSAAAPKRGTGSTAAPSQEPATTPPPPWTDSSTLGSVLAIPQTDGLRSISGKYLYQNRPPASIVYDNFPASSSFSPYDQYQMGYWNIYAKNLFRVLVHPSPTWAFGNGVFDLAGFPSNADMVSQFGRPWGANVLGVTYSRVVNNVIVEADIALNPAYAFTLDDRVSTRPGQPSSFKHTLLHELGHSWGLKHPWETQNVWWDSVMNYAPTEYRLPRLFTDDSTAARAAYPGISIRDGLLSAYTTQDSLTSNNPTYVAIRPSPAVVRAGNGFSVATAIRFENTGSVNLSNPVVEVYLVRQTFSFTGSIFLRSFRYSITVKPYTSQGLLLGSLTVPASTPAGFYYLAFFLRDSKDAYQGNNSAWSNYNVRLQVTR
jgi:hypothetical protein